MKIISFICKRAVIKRRLHQKNNEGNSKYSFAVQLSWSASIDNVGVKGYRVYRNNQEVATNSITNAKDSGPVPATRYTYDIREYEAAGNLVLL